MAFLGPESGWAAEASECADEQGAFWAFHDKLFATQAGENKGAFSKENLKRSAAALKLNSTAFDACLDSGKYASLIKTDTDMLRSLGVETTPTFLINGRVIAGALPFQQFKDVIETERAAKK